MRPAFFVCPKIIDRFAHLEEIVLQRSVTSLVLMYVTASSEYEQECYSPSHQCNLVVPMFFSETEMP